MIHVQYQKVQFFFPGKFSGYRPGLYKVFGLAADHLKVDDMAELFSACGISTMGLYIFFKLDRRQRYQIPMSLGNHAQCCKSCFQFNLLNVIVLTKCTSAWPFCEFINHNK